MANDKLKVDVTETAKQLEDKELERSIVAYLMSCSFEQIQQVRSLIKTEYFYHSVPRHIYQLIMLLNNNGENVSPMLIMPKMMQKFSSEHLEFIEILSYQNNFRSYIELLQHIEVFVDYAKRRMAWLVGQRLIKEGTSIGSDLESVTESIKRDLDNIVYDSVSDSSISMQQVLNSIQTIVDGNLAGVKNENYIKCGFKGIDDKSGLCSGDLDIIAASSSVGKTSMAVSMIINLIEQGENVAMFSTEMSPVRIVSRILSAYSNLYSSTILKRKMTKEQLDKFNDAMTESYEPASHLFFHERETSNFNEIVQCIRKLHSKHNIKVVFIDFIQRLSGKEKSESKFEFYARVSQVLKDIAKELGICVVALSQITDEETDKNIPPNIRYLPSVNKLKGSSEIFDAADNVWMIHRPSVISAKRKIDIGYPPPFEDVVTDTTAMVLIGKGRDDGTGEFIVGFDADKTHFYDIPENELPRRGVNVRQKSSIIEEINSKPKEASEDSTLPF